MPVTPEQFVKQYLPISFAACDADGQGKIQDGPSQQVHIRKYLNANFRWKTDAKDPKKRVYLPYEANKGMPWNEMKDAMLNFLMERARRQRGGLRLLVNHIIFSFDVSPEIYVPDTIFQNAFDGKCTPTEVRDVLRLFTYWQKVDPAAGKRWPLAQTFADQCLGLDCNGFVGAYFKMNYSWLGVGPQTPIGAYPTQRGAKVRKDLGELKPLDVLVFPGDVHIALLGATPLQRSPGQVVAHVCQSTGMGLNGVQDKEGTITKDAQGFLLGASRLKAIVGLLG